MKFWKFYPYIIPLRVSGGDRPISEPSKETNWFLAKSFLYHLADPGNHVSPLVVSRFTVNSLLLNIHILT